ncbi:glycoside hydrolase, partial [Cercophora newfieldiana]
DVHGILIVNGTAAPEWRYILDVRAPSANEADYPEWSQAYKIPPIIGPDNENVTCGRAAFLAAPRTETADIVAGSEVGFRVSADGYGVRDGVFSPPIDTMKYPNFWHPGPALVYLSRAPNDDLQNYKGDGDWFKIAYAGPLDDTHWSIWPSVSEFNFTIPKTTPPGKYLMRFENIFPTNTNLGYQQFYVNCAFVNIMGPGGGTPTEFIKFPGGYQPEDPGLLVPPDQDYMGGPVKVQDLKLMQYKPPGPTVWTG